MIGRHSEAIERDLIGLGLRLRWLGTESLTWRDLVVIVRSAKPGDAIFHAMSPDYPWPDQMAAESLALTRDVEYSSRWLQWAKTRDAEKNRNAPEPQRFSWEPKPKAMFAADSMSWDEAADFLGWDMEMREHMEGGA